MRTLIFLFAILSLSACHTSRQAKAANSSGSIDKVANSSRNRPSKKDKSIVDEDSKTSSDEYLETVSSTPSSSSESEKKTDDSNERPSKSLSKNSRLTSNLIEQADKLIGVSYRYGGTSPSRGFDCSGFTSYVFDKMDIDIPRTSTDQSRAGKRKNFKDADVGDLVFFGTGSRVTHVGIVVAKSKNRMEVIHSTSSSGVRIDEIFGSQYWNSRTLWAIDFDSLSSK